MIEFLIWITREMFDNFPLREAKTVVSRSLFLIFFSSFLFVLREQVVGCG